MPPHTPTIYGKIYLMRIEEFPKMADVKGRLFILRTADLNGWFVGSWDGKQWSTEAGDCVEPVYWGHLPV